MNVHLIHASEDLRAKSLHFYESIEVNGLRNKNKIHSMNLEPNKYIMHNNHFDRSVIECSE